MFCLFPRHAITHPTRPGRPNIKMGFSLTFSCTTARVCLCAASLLTSHFALGVLLPCYTFFFLLVFSVYPCLLLCSSHRVSSRVVWVPWGTSVHLSVYIWVEGEYEVAVDWLLGPVTAGVLFVSCGPLLTQTALLWEASCRDLPTYTLTQARTHTQTHIYIRCDLLWPFPWVLSNQGTAGATRPFT